MKALHTVVALTLFVTVSGIASAEGTKIEKSTLMNNSIINNTANLALGKDSTANAGSISVKNGAYVKDSTLLDAAIINNTANLALGQGSTANVGSIDIK